MLRYIVRRVALSVPTLLGITLVTFLISRALPADLVLANLGDHAAQDPQLVAAFRQRWGLNRPAPVQYLIYVEHLLRGDLGTSIATERPVRTELALSLPATVELASSGMLAAVVIGGLLGVAAAVRSDTPIDLAVRSIMATGVAIPTFWYAILLLFVFYFVLGWAPGPGQLDAGLAPGPPITGMYVVDSLLEGNWPVFRNALAHLVLPAVVLGTVGVGFIARITRATVLDVLQREYVRTARAKGLAEARVVWRHAVRSALIPIITVIGILYAQLMSGTVLTESIFSWPGLGRYAFSSAGNLDFPAIMGVALVIGVFYVALNLVVDVLYAYINPRIRYE
ncbi:MAG TPA: ABC transporter permease [bacterium]|nr:ABC transporter permease [bacterium]